MTIKAHLRTVLKSNEQLAALVADRIYGRKTPTPVVEPYLTVFVSNTDFEHHMRGTDETEVCFVQVNCYAESSGVAERLGRLVKKALDNHAGTSNGTKIQSCLIRNLQDDTWSEALALNRTIADFDVSYIDLD